MRAYLLGVRVFFAGLTKRFARERAALFFTFVVPLMFLFLFGALYGSDGTRFEVAIVDQSGSELAQRIVQAVDRHESVTRKAVGSLDEARELMSRGELDSIMVMPKGFGRPRGDGTPAGRAIVHYDEGEPEAGWTFATVVDGILAEVSVQLTGSPPPLAVERRAVQERGVSAFDHVFAGLLGFSLVSLGLFGPGNQIATLKKLGVLRRLRVTPLRTSQFILASALSYTVYGVLTVAVMIAAGVAAFGIEVRGDPVSLLVLVVWGTLLMFGFGMAIGGWARNANQAAPLTNLVGFPLMLLSGAFFPRFIMPEWLQDISAVLPLTPVIEGARLIITEGRALVDLGPQLALMAAWTIVIYAIGFRTFRWE